MPHKTNIEWADYSSNALRAEIDGKRGWACVKTSPGCAACYAETLNNRFGTQLDYTAPNARKVTHYIDEKELAHIVKFRHKPPYKGGTARPKVFPFDMVDLFAEHVPDELIDRAFAAFSLRPDVDFLVLTKRAERMNDYFSHKHRDTIIDAAMIDLCREHSIGWQFQHRRILPTVKLPLPNVWPGVSAEDQQRLDERLPWLLKTPAAVRFLSCEPLLGPIVLPSLGYTGCPTVVDWIIVGGESGHGSRRCDVAWIRSIVEQCKASDVPCFVKQLGASSFDSQCDDIGQFDGSCGHTMGINNGLHYLQIEHSKGGDPVEWPADLRVRQFPQPCGGGA